MNAYRNLRLLWIIFIFLPITISAQRYRDRFEKTHCLTLGLQQGGGSLFGVDYETMFSDRWGWQIGAGVVGFGGGINYHFRPDIRSSFLSLQYWNQGVGGGFIQNLIGPSFVYRGKRLLTFQAGVGFPLSTGPAYPVNLEQPPVMLMLSIGAYIPL